MRTQIVWLDFCCYNNCVGLHCVVVLWFIHPIPYCKHLCPFHSSIIVNNAAINNFIPKYFMRSDNQKNKFSEAAWLVQRVNYHFDNYCQLGLHMNPTTLCSQ